MRVAAVVIGLMWAFVVTPIMLLLVVLSVEPFFGSSPKGGDRLAGVIAVLTWSVLFWAIMRLWHAGSERHDRSATLKHLRTL